MMLVAGITDVRLKEKLSELEEPTLPAFTTIIDAHLDAKATTGNTEVVNKVFTPGGNRNKGQNKQGGQGGQGQQRLGISDAEKKRRTVTKGKFYQCGSGDHMANNCQVTKDIKCRRDSLTEEPMNVPDMHIYLSENAIPYRISTPHQVPLRFQEEADQTIVKLMKAGVIVKVDGPEPCCAPAFFVPKADGVSVRMVTDFTDASRLDGLGFAMRHNIDGRFKLVMCGLKALSPTQQR